MITNPIATIAIIAAVPMPNTYVSVIVAGVGTEVAAGASSTYIAVSELDGQ